jgi:hypothetical protein
MAVTKAKIYNLALGALLLQRRVSDPETDQSNEARVLNTHYEAALDKALIDCDLDSTSTEATLALVEEDPNDDWEYSYTYPANAALFRRVKSLNGSAPDNRSSHVPKKIQIVDGVKVILTDEPDAVGEYIDRTVSLTYLSWPMAFCVAYQLAMLAAPLIVGKGAKALRDEISAKYLISKAEAQEHDKQESFNFIDESIESEFVEARTS